MPSSESKSTAAAARRREEEEEENGDEDKRDDAKGIASRSEAKASGSSSGGRWSGSGDDKAAAKGRAEAEADADGNGTGGEALVQKVISFFFDDDSFANTFERFAEDKCQVFDLATDENKLEYTEVYNEFQELFEAKIEAFIRSQGATVDEFYQSVRAAYERDRESSLVLCSEILVATADFDVFVLMMKQTKESQQLAKQHS